MNFILTTNCNKGCPYCFAHENRVNDPNNFMSLKQFEKLLNKSETHVKLLGGEPTQHPQFKEIIQLLIDKKRNFTLISNFLFSNDILEMILKANKVLNIDYLINATDLDEFNRIKLWSKNYNTIYSFLYKTDREEKMSIGITLYNHNKDYYINYLNFIKDNVPLERLRISINFPGDKKDKENFYFINNKELGTIILALVSFSLNNGIKPSIDCIIFPCMFNNKEEFKYINKFVENLKLKCGENRAPADIFPDNTISYCYPLKEVISLDLNKYSNDKEAVDDMITRYKIIESIVDVPKDCKECRFYKKICNGPCLGFYNLSNINLGINK